MGSLLSHSLHIDSRMSDEQRRAALYEGQLFVFSSMASVRRFVDFAREMIEDAFAPLDPETAQHELAVERYAEILGTLKPRFIHHPESKQHLRNILTDLGCDLEQTYFDVPRLRSSTSDSYLTTGIAYAWHPHRDTWYSAPLCQQNFWLPVYEIESSNAMAFHTGYWNRALANNSRDYNYYVWNSQHRGPDVAKLLKEDPRPLPRAVIPVDLGPQTRLISPVGSILVFSGAHLHSSVPNTSGRTRYSIDFRTVHLGDAMRRVGAPRCDEECTGTTMRDYIRGTDLSRLPEHVIALYDDETVGSGVALYKPQPADTRDDT
jgi:hypothetical protein